MLATHPVFALANLEHLELLSAGALGHLPLDLVVDPLGVGEGAAVLPVGPQRRHELSPVDHAVSVVKLVSHGVHLQLGGGELVLQDPVDELIAGTVAVTVVIQLPEEVLHPGLFVVVVLQETFAPIVPIEVLDLFQFLQIVQFFFETTIPFPSHHPDMTPFLPKGLGARILVLVIGALAYAGAAKN